MCVNVCECVWVCVCGCVCVCVHDCRHTAPAKKTDAATTDKSLVDVEGGEAAWGDDFDDWDKRASGPVKVMHACVCMRVYLCLLVSVQLHARTLILC